MLTNEQLRAARGVISSLAVSNDVALIGRAGTGKTTTVQYIASLLKHVIVCAPTHAALEVLKSKLSNDNYAFKTVAGLLSAKKHTNFETGAQLFYYRGMDINTKDQQVLIIDESSMVDSSAFDMIASTSIPRIWVGDSGQLPPVATPNFDIFKRIPEEHTYRLNTNMRCGQGNALFDLIERIYEGDLSLPEESLPYIQYITKEDLTDDSLVIVYRNETRKKVNSYLFEKFHNRVYGPGVPLIANQTCRIGKTRIYNSERLSIETAKRVEIKLLNSEVKELLAEHGVTYVYRIKATVSNRTVEFTYLDEEVIDNILKELEVSKQWRKYYNLKEYFPEFVLGYAITAHRSQGSTFEEVCIAWKDLMQSEQAQQLLYVATSRSSHKIKII